MKRIVALLLSLLIGAQAEAAWTYRGIGTAAANGTNTALVPTLPSGWQVGDVAILATGSRGAGQTLTVSGWDEIATLTTNRSDKVFCRVLESGDTSPSFDWSSSNFQSAVIAAWHGGATSCADIVVHQGTTNSSGRTSQPLADATITTANTLVVFVSFKSKSATSDTLTMAPPGGVTEIWDSVVAGTAQSSWLGYQSQTTATSISGLSITQGGTTESTQHQGFTLSLTSGGVGGPGSPPVGKDDITVASVAVDTWCEGFNAVATPDIAVGDTIRIDEVTTPGGYTLTHGTDCSLEYAGDDSRQTVEYDIYDTSAAGWMTGGPGLLVFNNQAPGCSAPVTAILDVGAAMTAIDLAAGCPDPENDTPTCSLTSGTLPTGISLGGTGNCTLSGTPTVENEAGAAVTFTIDDGYGGTATQDYTIYPITTITVPTCTGGVDIGACVALVDGTGFLLIGNTNYSCDAGVASGDVISQNPAAAAEVEYGTSVNFVVSTGTCTNKRRPMQMAVGIR